MAICTSQSQPEKARQEINTAIKTSRKAMDEVVPPNRALTLVLCLCASRGPSKDETTEGRQTVGQKVMAIADISKSFRLAVRRLSECRAVFPKISLSHDPSLRMWLRQMVAVIAIMLVEMGLCRT